jgi:hypothetical protein
MLMLQNLLLINIKNVKVNLRNYYLKKIVPTHNNTIGKNKEM